MSLATCMAITKLFKNQVAIFLVIWSLKINWHIVSNRHGQKYYPCCLEEVNYGHGLNEPANSVGRTEALEYAS